MKHCSGNCLYSLFTGTTHYTGIYSRRKIQITGVSCYGNEYRLTDCGYSINELGECQYDDIGVTCNPGIYLYESYYTGPLYPLIVCISCYKIWCIKLKMKIKKMEN